MLVSYIDKALELAVYEIIEDEGTYWGEIPGLQGVWARHATLEGCRRELREALSELGAAPNDPGTLASLMYILGISCFYHPGGDPRRRHSWLQTVFPQTNPRYHQLIEQFGQTTGAPVLRRNRKMRLCDGSIFY